MQNANAPSLVRIWSDASVGQPGPVAISWVIRYRDRLLASGAKIITPPGSGSRHGEISGVEAAALEALRLVDCGALPGASEFHFHSDCSGLVLALAKKIPARYCKTTFRQIWGLAASLGEPAFFVHVPRSKNREAHRLAHGLRVGA